MKVAVSSQSFESNVVITTDVSERNPLVAGAKYEIRQGGAKFYYLSMPDGDLLAYGPSYKTAHNWGEFTVLGPDMVTCPYSRSDDEVVTGILVMDSEGKMHILEDGDFILGYLGTEESLPN